MNNGKTIFSQIMSNIPEREFKACVDRYKGNYRSRNFTCKDQFLVMSYAQLTNRGGLRDIENCLTALSSKKVRPLYAKDDFRLDLDNMVYAFDSSTISLCLKLCPWAKFRKHKGGIKMHTLLDLRGNLPVSVYLTEASVHDVKALDYLYIEPSAIYLMDKGYVDFYRLFHLIHEKNAFFVTRAKDNMRFDITACCEVDKSTGVIADEKIKLIGLRTSQWYPEEIRMVTYEDYATNNVYRFLTNNMEYEALTISELYRERWNVELFFKWIKQHLHIKSFYGTSENAIYLQIWIAVCTYLLLALTKKKMHMNQSLHTISKNVGLFLTDKTPINELFNKTVPEKESTDYYMPSLFGPEDF